MSGGQSAGIKEGQQFRIDTFRPEDAAGVARLFTTVYGNGYPVRLVYDPAALVSAFHAKENIPVVARTENGDIVGHNALFRSAPNPKLYETGQTLVLPAYRGIGISVEMNRYICDVIAKEFDVDAIFSEAVCNHTYMQKSWSGLAGQGAETALEVDLMPAEAYTQEQSSSGRVSVLSMFKIYRKKPHRVCIPPIYREQLTYIYSKVNDARTFELSSKNIPREATTESSSRVFDFANTVRIAFSGAGRDFDSVFDKKEAELLSGQITVIQVWLELGMPWIGRIVDSLRDRGYFLGGVFPQWFDKDGLLMQKVIGTPNWEGIQLYSERAKTIMDFVRADWKTTAR
ncbi:MAG: hypothetical protein A4E63_01848 [Syntrophorhabdus sp. PtaU1.Bin050]|nr:MAG: hypothetical protein A4E63_01848 [Syntrophorhabdus sp. PtaU1.Bin050]